MFTHIFVLFVVEYTQSQSSACVVVTVSNLPDELAECNGAYRPADSIAVVGLKEEKEEGVEEGGILVWSHVADSMCQLLHDRAGRSVVTTSALALMAQCDRLASWGQTSGAMGADATDSCSKRWAQVVEESSSSSGNAWATGGSSNEATATTSVMCTSAGKTTRLLYSLFSSDTSDGLSNVEDNMETPGLPLNSACEYDSNNEDDGLADETASSYSPSWRGEKIFEFASTQNGTIVSAAQGNIHIRVSREATPAAAAAVTVEATPKTTMVDTDDEEGYSIATGTSESNLLLDATTTTNNGESVLDVKIMANGNELTTLPLDNAIDKGILVNLRGLEGTQVLELFLLERWRGQKHQHQQQGRKTSVARDLGDARVACLASCPLFFEAFSAENSVVQQRRPSLAVATVATMTKVIAAHDGDGELSNRYHRQQDIGNIAGGVGMRDGASAGEGAGTGAEARVVFVVDVGVVDGYKLSTLHLIRHLRPRIRASVLDLSCDGEIYFV